MKKKKTAKKHIPKIKSYQQHCLDDYKEQFNQNARKFAVMMFGHGGDYDPSKGPGVHCVDMHGTLRALEILFIKIVAHTEAISVASGGMR